MTRRTNFICTVDGCMALAIRREMCGSHYYRWKRHGIPTAGGTYRGERLAWLKRHVFYQSDDCLIAEGLSGYWPIKDGSRRTAAHRWMCEKVHGPAPSKEHEAAHSCGKGHLGCVNPGHLRWATPSENNADKVFHGTQQLGTSNRSAKLTEADVITIRRLSTHLSQEEIAKRYSISRSNVGSIVSGKTWKWLSEKPENRHAA